MKRLLIASICVTACAGAPRGARAPTPLTSVDTVFYEVAGNTPAEWRRQLPLAAQASGLSKGAVTFTLAHMLVVPGVTRTTPTGCQFDRSLLQLRVGHVMPRLSASASPTAADRGAWNEFIVALWERAHLREEVGQRLADSIRVEVRRERAQECAPLLELTRRKVEGFGARYSADVQAAEEALGEPLRPIFP